MVADSDKGLENWENALITKNVSLCKKDLINSFKTL